ncbi:hypothetical protein CAPTEDRAFT_194389 [Capitella teleta]|uniref:G-protein coupled receptors family 1 profile domain-containing protein n=1 Tax=Capitella teleta TaxID=283909 RepID=R7VHZ4_CAPTE|nr:hypothetical protein CAPTEDRAFT_194389 [Capitella teleta]|eukprot:ELU18219.1 hypothetical protein CAPTEDRAFT_194389 [Capitella teleta]
MASQDINTDEFYSNITAFGRSKQISCDLPVSFYIIVNVIILGVICILGLIGNTLSVIVLHRERGNRVVVLLLQSLAVADNACLILALIHVPFIHGILPSIPRYSNTVRLVEVYFQKYIEPVAHMAQTGSIWTVVLLAANRYFAICRPFQAQTYLTMARTKIQVAGVVIFSVALNIPRFFQLHVIIDRNISRPGNRIRIFRSDSEFDKIYTNIVYTVFVLAGPFILLTILNCRSLQAYSDDIANKQTTKPPDMVVLVIDLQVVAFVRLWVPFIGH